MRWKEWRRGRGDSLGIQDAKVGFKFQEANCECQGVLKNSECQKNHIIMKIFSAPVLLTLTSANIIIVPVYSDNLFKSGNISLRRKKSKGKAQRLLHQHHPMSHPKDLV
eukprot:scaffold5460_cov153-Skeletonema_dohrnii-CCMP3373.AAC.3